MWACIEQEEDDDGRLLALNTQHIHVHLININNQLYLIIVIHTGIQHIFPVGNHIQLKNIFIFYSESKKSIVQLTSLSVGRKIIAVRFHPIIISFLSAASLMPAKPDHLFQFMTIEPPSLTLLLVFDDIG